MDQSDRSVGVDYISIFHPNNPPLVQGMLIGCVATDTSSSNFSIQSSVYCATTAAKVSLFSTWTTRSTVS